jgi:hypothetical protein
MANVKIIMPEDSTGHTGIVLKGGSTIAVTDVVSFVKVASTCYNTN